MSKIVSITPKGQWQEFYKLEVRFENGDFGTAFAKSQTPPYAVGDEVEYTKNDKGTLKISKQNNFGGYNGGNGGSFANTSKVSGDERSASIIRQVALKAAVEYGCAASHDINTILGNAETFNAWMTGQSTAPAQEHFANRNDNPFWLVSTDVARPPFGVAFLFRFICYFSTNQSLWPIPTSYLTNTHYPS